MAAVIFGGGRNDVVVTHPGVWHHRKNRLTILGAPKDVRPCLNEQRRCVLRAAGSHQVRLGDWGSGMERESARVNTVAVLAEYRGAVGQRRSFASTAVARVPSDERRADAAALVARRRDRCGELDGDHRPTGDQTRPVLRIVSTDSGAAPANNAAAIVAHRGVDRCEGTRFLGRMIEAAVLLVSVGASIVIWSYVGWRALRLPSSLWG